MLLFNLARLMTEFEKYFGDGGNSEKKFTMESTIQEQIIKINKN